MPPSRRAAGRPHAAVVTREDILAAAIALIDAEGYAAFSVRRLARTMGVTPATIAHHVGSRTDILVAAVDAMLSEVPDVDRMPYEDWRDAVRILAAAYREVLRRHPRAGPLLVDVGSRSHAGLRLTIRLMLTLHRAGVPASHLVEMNAAVVAYVTGFAFQESPVGMAGISRATLLQRINELSEDGDREEFLRLLPDLMDAEQVKVDAAHGESSAFDDGLEALLAGLSQRLATRSAKA